MAFYCWALKWSCLAVEISDSQQCLAFLVRVTSCWCGLEVVHPQVNSFLVLCDSIFIKILYADIGSIKGLKCSQYTLYTKFFNCIKIRCALTISHESRVTRVRCFTFEFTCILIYFFICFNVMPITCNILVGLIVSLSILFLTVILFTLLI